MYIYIYICMYIFNGICNCKYSCTYIHIYICISIHTVALVFKPTYKLQLQVVFLVTIKHDGSSITHGDLQRTYDWCLFVNLNFIFVCVHVNI